jgi:hypothetical protein
MMDETIQHTKEAGSAYKKSFQDAKEVSPE